MLRVVIQILKVQLLLIYSLDTSLKDFIDNDRAGYFGGGSSSGGTSVSSLTSDGILSARISSDGTIVSQTPEWIEENTHNAGTYILYTNLIIFQTFNGSCRC